ncbi:orotidine-5'-phosphate decarboxylase [Brevibacterium salitolerans]|uniref:Orotidine-5'-phosphate decarboxylase n=1 Tax=Brevibacterium salitolerans TaxID=1403566 RepID=A0ABN2WFN2_9MICO
MSGAPARLRTALLGSPLCVGLDPHPGELASWGLPDTPAGAREFSLRLLGAVGASGRCRVVKPQVALYERFGSRGFAVLEEVLAAAREAGLFAIADAKRGDIGSTMAGYASAWLSHESPLQADAVTVSPYLGFGSLAPVCEAVTEFDGMAFVLALTSNPSGPQVQHARTADGGSVAGTVVAEAAAANAVASAPRLGLVVGATVGGAARELGIGLADFAGPILTPGYGAQGASAEDLRALFGEAGAQGRLAVNSSRGISGLGPSDSALREGIVRAADDLAAALGVD